jgi:predicted dehydrogenase
MSMQVAIVGAGSGGFKLIEAFDGRPDCRVARVCDHNYSRLLSVQERFPHLPITAVFDEIVQDDAIAAVVMATPAPARFELALTALQAGKHLWLEAPLALSRREADQLVETAGRHNRALAVGHTPLYHPVVAEMKDMMALGEIGDLCYMESSRLGPALAGATVNVLWQQAAHDVAVALYLAGEQPREVTAVGHDFSGQGLLDVALVTVHFADGRFSQHHVSWLSPHRVRRFFVSGRKGALVFSDNRREDKLRLFHLDEWDPNRAEDGELREQEGQAFSLSLEAMRPPEPERDDSALARQCADFIAAARDGHAPLAGGQNGREVVRVLLAAEQSIARGSTPIVL